MREIKFRGQRKDTKEWLYGSLLLLKGKTYINCPSFNDEESYRNSSYSDYEVIPETVGQFTGLKDKNGKEIYEGDILHYKDTRKEKLDADEDFVDVIEYQDYGYNFRSESMWHPYNPEHHEVIGNIHGNPELLK